MEVRVRVPTALRELVGGTHTVVVMVEAGSGASRDAAAGNATVSSVLDALAVEHPALERRVRDELGRRRAHVNLFVGDDNVRDLQGLATPIPPGIEVSILPAVSGG
jgi:molybdopterin converting factor small subunit